MRNIYKKTIIKNRRNGHFPAIYGIVNFFGYMYPTGGKYARNRKIAFIIKKYICSKIWFIANNVVRVRAVHIYITMPPPPIMYEMFLLNIMFFCRRLRHIRRVS